MDELDPVIQIASMVSVVGRPTPVVRNVMTLDTCAPIAGAEVMSFADEKALLRRWRDLVIEADPGEQCGEARRRARRRRLGRDPKTLPPKDPQPRIGPHPAPTPNLQTSSSGTTRPTSTCPTC